MHYSSRLEYIVGNSYLNNFYTNYSNVSCISKSVDTSYGINSNDPIVLEQYNKVRLHVSPYRNQQNYFSSYVTNQSFNPEIFLNPSRPKMRFIEGNNEVKNIAKEIFELIMEEELPINISINILPFDEFKLVHSIFGAWNDGILGFSLNGNHKKIFVRENHLDTLMLVIGHEIGHVMTETLQNKHDEEAKAFAFSIEWAKTIKEHNVANLSLSIKDNIDLLPARNGLHDVAFSFVDFMVKRGRKAIELHDDLVRRYVSVFNLYC